MKELEKKGGDVSIALKGTREVYFDEEGGMLETPVYNRESLNAGMIFSGPGIIEESDSTTVIPPEWMAEVDNFGNLTLKSEQ
tara:strand:- start:757 stop:1002 length:246 start_codon:yes stop_codon:yes gene_type:complete